MTVRRRPVRENRLKFDSERVWKAVLYFTVETTDGLFTCLLMLISLEEDQCPWVALLCGAAEQVIFQMISWDIQSSGLGPAQSKCKLK